MNARMIFVAMAGVLFVCVPVLAEWTEPVPVSEINTAYNDKPSFLSFDGLTLYFSRSETDTFNYSRIYQATRPEPYGSFTSVEEISTLNYSEGHVYVGWVSPDNLRMYYMRVEPGSTPPPPWPPLSTGPIGRLKVTERASIYDPWLPGTNISELNALGDVYIPSLTEDELTIFFTGINLPGRQGYHIWMATRPDMNSPFGNVRNLTEINSAAGEVGPHISPDGLVLYFTSNRNGIGLCFKATRASVGDPFGNIEQLSFLDSPGSSVGNVFSSSDGTALYFNKKINEQTWDAYVSYLIEPATLVGLEIIGPDEVAENFSASYKAIAHYDDDSTRDVTNLALWAVEPEAIASIEAGALTTKDIIKDELATIWASYTEGNVTVETEKAIDILAICPTGTALRFDGVDDYVEVPHSDVFNSNEISIEGWFYSNILTAGSRGILSKAYVTKPYIGIWTQSNLKLAFEWANSSRYEKLTSSTNLQTNKWYHFAIVFASNNNVKLFINANLDNSKTTTIPYLATHNTNTLRIGRLHAGYPIFDGFIDEVAIYNRALSAEEIWAGMHMRLTGDEPGLVGYWDLDEGQGQIVYDLSGNGNDGQLGSTPDVDESDPAWVESDAPIGYCTPYLIAIGAAKDALKHKRASLKELEAALAQEWTMYEALEQWLESGDFVDLSKGDIVKAKQKTHSAMQHEEQSIDALEKGFEKLLDSLIALGYGPQPP
ncbi:MAG TPA: LamG-like jellyroll fold domain-containing protein, partial [Sedimentisphaerales bacterium]|nr:LamG-like jellyroll fold domain-containing protein [Sedimentisphaerales bacterium]